MIPTGKPTSVIPKGLLLVSSAFQKDFYWFLADGSMANATHASAMLRHVVVTELASCWCCAGVLARNVLVSSLALAGAPIRIALVSSPYFAGVIPLGVPVSVQLQRHLRYVIVHCIVVESVPLRQR